MQALVGHARQPQKRIQDSPVKAPAGPLDQRQHAGVVLGQGFELLRRQGGRILCRMKRHVLQRQLQQVQVQRAVVLEVTLLLALPDPVQRRLCYVQMSTFYQLGHLPIEEGQQQGADMGAVHVRIGHDDDAVVAQLVRVVFLAADAAAERRDQCTDFGRCEHLVEPGLLDVQDLALERQNGLRTPVAGLFCRASGGITLDQVELAQAGVLFLTIGQLAGQPRDIQDAFAAGHLARPPGRLTGPRSIDDLGHDGARLGRTLQQEIVELVRDGRLDDALDLG
jgi:hypothetical protein